MSISAITLAELRFGARRPEADPADEAKLDLFLSVLAVRPFDATTAEAYGTFAGRVAIRGGVFDRLIAAQAIALDLTLVTNNTRDFTDIPGLRVENWASA